MFIIISFLNRVIKNQKSLNFPQRVKAFLILLKCSISPPVFTKEVLLVEVRDSFVV